MFDFKVKEELTKLDELFLLNNGFILHTGCPYKEFGNFEIILNPCIEGKGKIIINFCADEVDYHVEENILAYDIWKELNQLITRGIIYTYNISE